MATTIKFCVLLFLILGLNGTMAVIYEIGEYGSWNSITNYNTWSAANTFNIDDSIVFKYDAKIHNVQEVSEKEYNDCTAKAPIATYTHGNDQVMLESDGDHFFICSYPGMCEAGQKVKIHVEPSPTQPAPISDTSSHHSSSDIMFALLIVFFLLATVATIFFFLRFMEFSFLNDHQ